MKNYKKRMKKVADELSSIVKEFDTYMEEAGDWSNESEVAQHRGMQMVLKDHIENAGEIQSTRQYKEYKKTLRNSIDMAKVQLIQKDCDEGDFPFLFGCLSGFVVIDMLLVRLEFEHRRDIPYERVSSKNGNV